MTLNVFMFYLLSATILVFSVLTVTSRKILRAAVYLLFVLIGTAGLYFLLNYEFLAAVQLAIYAGGIVILIIFSILLTSHISHKFKHPALANFVMGAFVALLGSGIVLYTLFNHPFQRVGESGKVTDMNMIGNQLMSLDKNGYVLPFELISILLLAAMVAAIIIAKKGNHKTEKS
ncbi:MAG TPA: NADH-quinone oxidoreductase subunit J [Prolixibacteraceae bacterium]|nr:NADH-quinone oxidoreductase subunit J [Prolixibacteraceae bacterium]